MKMVKKWDETRCELTLIISYHKIGKRMPLKSGGDIAVVLGLDLGSSNQLSHSLIKCLSLYTSVVC